MSMPEITNHVVKDLELAKIQAVLGCKSKALRLHLDVLFWLLQVNQMIESILEDGVPCIINTERRWRHEQDCEASVNDTV